MTFLTLFRHRIVGNLSIFELNVLKMLLPLTIFVINSRYIRSNCAQDRETLLTLFLIFYIIGVFIVYIGNRLGAIAFIPCTF